MRRSVLDLFVLFAVVLGSFEIATPTNAEEPKKDQPAPQTERTNGYDEKILEWLKKPNDTPSLIAYLNEVSPSDDDLLSIPILVKQLGDPRQLNRKQAVQRLVAVGAAALPALREVDEDKDLEVAERAREALKLIGEATRTNRVLPSIRLLTKRRAAGALEAILRFLPYTIDETIEEEIYYSLDELALVDGKLHLSLIAGLKDRLPARRAVAGTIVARMGAAGQKMEARGLLSDKIALVRLRTAQGFLAEKDTSVVATIIDLLTEESPALVWQAEELLHWLGGDDAPEAVTGACTPAERTACRDAWSKWWNENAVKLSMDEVYERGRKPLLVISYGEKQAVLIGCNNRKRWERPGEPAALLAEESIVITTKRDETVKSDQEVTPRNPRVPFVYLVTARTLTGDELWSKRFEFHLDKPLQAGRRGTALASCAVRRGANLYDQWLEIDKNGHYSVLAEHPADSRRHLNSMTTTGEFIDLYAPSHRNDGRPITFHSNYAREPLFYSSVYQAGGRALGAAFRPQVGAYCIVMAQGKKLAKDQKTLEFVSDDYRYLSAIDPLIGPAANRIISPFEQSIALLRDGNIFGAAAPHPAAKFQQPAGPKFGRLVESNPEGVVYQELSSDAPRPNERMFAPSRPRFAILAPLVRFGFPRPTPRHIDELEVRLTDMRSSKRSMEQRRLDFMALAKYPERSGAQKEAFHCVNDPDALIRILAMHIVDKVENPPKEIVPSLIRAMEDEEADVRRLASPAIMRCAEDSWEPVLLTTLDEKASRTLRINLASFLGRFPNAKNPKIVAGIQALLRQPDEKLRQQALYGVLVTRKADKREGNGLAQLLFDDLCRVVAESDHAQTLRHSIEIISSLGTDGAKAVPYLMKVKGHSMGDALSTIGVIGKGDAKALQFLVDSLKDRALSPEARAGAVWGLRNMGAEARPVALPGLLWLLQEEVDLSEMKVPPEGREYLWQSLMVALKDVGLNVKDRHVLPVLQRMLALKSCPGHVDQLDICKLIEAIDPELGKKEYDRIVAERKRAMEEQLQYGPYGKKNE